VGLAHRAASVLALAAQLCALLHAALVPHVTCAEHGDLVHAATGAPSPSPLPLAALDGAVTGDEDPHERCLLDEDGEHAPAPAPAPAPVPLPAAPPPVYALAPARRTRATPVYVIAPKNSPPV